jgi:ATP-dependent Clp protease ATP-binding subunit ClpB
MKRAIQRLIQDPLALKILDGEFGEGDTVFVDRDGAEMHFDKKAADAVQAVAAD